jgi:hypothetical protein
VDSAAIVAALKEVYGAKGLASELIGAGQKNLK